MPEENSFYTFKELCGALSITQASGRNWLKTGKISPQKYNGNKLMFSRTYLLELKRSINKPSVKLLKSRRNKKFLSGSRLYLDYISPASPNSKAVLQAVEAGQGTMLAEIRATLADCACQLITEVFGPEKLSLFRELISDISPDKLKRGDFTFVPREDTLGVLYVSLLNLRRRKASGIYYTPQKTVKESNEKLFTSCQQGRVIDPCCGTGNFLLQLPDSYDPALVYGSDIDPLAVAIARINFALKFKVDDADFIKRRITRDNLLHPSAKMEYDFIIGNPPWGYDFSGRERAYIIKHYTSSESACCLTEAAIKQLAPEGKLAFVLPESLLQTRKHHSFRKFLLNNCCIDFVEYIGDVFDGVQCPGVILGLSKRKQQKFISVTYNNDSFQVEAAHALNNDGFKLCIKNGELKIIEKILGLQHSTTLKGNGTFALGIVTGDNEKHLFDDPATPQYEPVVRGTDIKKYHIASAEKFLHYTPDVFQQTAPEHIYRTSPKLLYRFIGRELAFACDWNGVLSLNSCNIIVPHIKELDIRYIMAVLNSRIVQFFFDKYFNSVKILRSHLEEIPIPLADKSVQNEIISYAEQLAVPAENADLLYEKTDKKIAALYGLDETEYQTIVAATGRIKL